MAIEPRRIRLPKIISNAMKQLLPLCLLFLFTSPLHSQIVTKDSAASIIMIYGSLGVQIPGGDLKDRFGFSFQAGPGFMYKTDRNWMWGLDGDFLFGNEVKENLLFRNIETETGYVIDASGLYADVYLSERGYRIGPRVGKVFNLTKNNANSGLLISISPGFLQHKIRIDNPNYTAPQLDKEYLKGYDRLTNGFALTEFIGYYYSGKYRMVSFFAGFEFTQAWTKSRRDWDFDTMQKNEMERMDLLNGFKIGWIIQLSRSRTQEYYYY